MCRSTFDRRIQLELNVAERTPPAVGNPGQIEQVLLNICLNARDAVLDSARPNPEIRLRIEPVSAQRVLMHVADNGIGMTEAVRARVFEPFFTTKEIGRGTGLGLASAYAIITDHGGSIRVSSRLGEGSELEFELPASPEPIPARSVPDGAHVPAGFETILLVDDEEAVRRVFRRMLERSGFQVVECGSGLAAIEQLESGSLAINAMLIDRSMPGLSGEQVIARLAERGIHLPILLLSGHPTIEIANPDVLAVLSKPISRQALLGALRSALDEWGLRRLR
jgi:two-component system cell cycle sensor histidine kinase/response regulator CckA